MSLITLRQYFDGREFQYPEDLTTEVVENAKALIHRVSGLLLDLGFVCVDVSSGWRPPAVNASTKGAAVASSHMSGMGIDVADPLRAIAISILSKEQPELLLQQYDLYIEDPRWTPKHVHFQIRPPGSGRRIYIPNASPPLTGPILAGKDK